MYAYGMYNYNYNNYNYNNYNNYNTYNNNYNHPAIYTSNHYNFYAATQQPCESFTQFANRLRVLASRCNFQNLDDELHFRFVMGMLPGPERSMLYTVEVSRPLTFAKAVEFVEGLRYTRGVTNQWVTPLKTACESNPEDAPSQHSEQKAIMVCHDAKKSRRSTRSRISNHKSRSRNLIRLNILNED